MLAAAAVVVQLIPGMPTPPDSVVAQIVTVALVLILFDGGRHIGWSRSRPALVPIIIVGVLGTFLTAAGSGVLLHLGFGLAWYLALLVGTAVSPTDPAVVFSVLGRQEIAGRSGTILEGESGANDPVGIALMGGLLAAGGLSGAALGGIAIEFVLQMAIGLAAGVAGGVGLLAFMRRVSLPSEALYPLRTLASVLLLYPMQPIRPEPWTLAVRLQAEPDSAYQVAIAPGSVVDGRTVEEVANLVGNVWIGMVVRDGALLPARGDTQLHAGDMVTLLIDEDSSHEVAMFTEPDRS
jgi:cell volume regulation protein A